MISTRNMDDDVPLGWYRDAVAFRGAVLEFTNGGEQRLLNSLGHDSGQDPRFSNMAIDVDGNFQDYILLKMRRDLVRQIVGISPAV